MIGDKLNPEIHLPDAAFGYGRRVCSGRQLAEASIWLTITSLLAVFKFERKSEDEGKDYGPYTAGTVA
jgi:cytochrome P450